MTRQGFHQWLKREQALREVEAAVLAAVRAERHKQPKIGVRKLYEKLGAGIPFGRDALFTLLRRNGLLVRRRPKPPITTYTGEARHPNLVGKDKPDRVGEVVVSDITYLKTQSGPVYLALVTDLCSRRILGYNVSKSLRSELCLGAMRRAVRVLGDLKECMIHHSDRGVQYTCHDYLALLRHNHVYSSLTERMHCAENAVAERLNGILKHELGLKACFKHLQHARQCVVEAIMLYNNERPHTALGYATPNQYYRAHIN